jgi:hypothetical protein
VDSQSLTAKAHAIADQYLAAIPGTYNGRYSELAEPDVILAIFRAVTAGLKDAAACEAAGINRTTLGRWLQRAEAEPHSAYAAFAHELKAMRQQRKVRILERLEKASESPQYWTAGAWLLERTEPEEFALRKDDSQAPRVVVQIGVQNSDVQITVGETPQPSVESVRLSPPLTGDLHSLTVDR